jgi:hypothetical protein
MKSGDSDNVNIINEVINLELNSAMNTYIPKKIIRVRPQDKPWINIEIKCKIRKRNGWKKISPFTLIGVFVVLVLLNFETLFAIRHHLPGGKLTFYIYSFKGA